ncbi:glycosyltransferase [Streptomyces olindensis]|uniref:glycosyltransferase n=1 Tax=Streptomyces olindensis TaxID=358823 RepID=UPI003F4CD52D
MRPASYLESFGLVALEAQACGTPVIAADPVILGRMSEAAAWRARSFGRAAAAAATADVCTAALRASGPLAVPAPTA